MCTCDHTKNFNQPNQPNLQPPFKHEEDQQNKHECTCAASKRTADGVIRLKNPNLAEIPNDILYHLNLGTATHDLQEMFIDVKFVCIGGNPTRMKYFANYIKEELSVEIPTGACLTDISNFSYRYVLYKAGPVLFVSYGIGISGISIILHEIIKLMHYAKCKNPIFFRIGSCGGLGVQPGTVIISESVCDSMNRDHYELCVLGFPVRRPAKLDQKISNRLKKFARLEDGYETISGKTMCTFDYYEEQACLNGAVCEYTEKDKLEYLNRLKSMGIVNMEMESMAFAALTYHCGIQAAMVSVAIIDRLKDDQPMDCKCKDQLEMFHIRPMILVGRYIKKYFEKLKEKRRREMPMLI